MTREQSAAKIRAKIAVVIEEVFATGDGLSPALNWFRLARRWAQKNGCPALDETLSIAIDTLLFAFGYHTSVGKAREREAA